MKTAFKKNDKKRISHNKRIKTKKSLTPKSLKKGYSSSGILNTLLKIIHKNSNVARSELFD